MGSFKLRGKRISRMAPIHHHFELLGWSESKVIVRFWIAALDVAVRADDVEVALKNCGEEFGAGEMPGSISSLRKMQVAGRGTGAHQRPRRYLRAA